MCVYVYIDIYVYTVCRVSMGFLTILQSTNSGTLVAGGRYHMIACNSSVPHQHGLCCPCSLAFPHVASEKTKKCAPQKLTWPSAMDQKLGANGPTHSWWWFKAANFPESIPALAQGVRQRPLSTSVSSLWNNGACWWTKCNSWREQCKSISITLSLLPEAHLTKCQQYSKLVA